MSLFNLMSRYFWVLLLALSLVNYVAASRWIGISGVVRQLNMKVARRYLVWLALMNSMPWLVMGWGEIVGGVPSLWYFLRPQDGNAYVIAWVGSVLLLTVLYACWVLLLGGARKVREFQLMSVFGMRSVPGPSELAIKVIAALIPLVIVGAMFLATLQNVPVPH